MLLLLIACAAETDSGVDPRSDALLALGIVSAGTAFAEVRASVAVATGEPVDAMPVGGTAEGSTTLDAGALGLDAGSLAVAWTVSRSEEAGGLQRWSWTIDADAEGLALEPGVVDASGQWTVEDVVWDVTHQSHRWSGELRVDGGLPDSAEWAAYHGEALDWVTGSVDGVEVSWEAEG